MKKSVPITAYVLSLLIVSAATENALCNQEKSKDTMGVKIINLSHGTKLVLGSTIDTTDSLSVQIISGIRDMVSRVQSLIPTDSITIELAISSSNVLPFLGLGGRTNKNDSSITIEYYYDPGNPNFKTESLINGLVHECCHASRLRMPHWQLTMLECMITEGLADHFMIEVTHCDIPKWSQAISEDEIERYLIKAKPILYTKHDSWNKEFNEKYFVPWMFGRSGEDPIAGWTGYTLGWRIVDNYLKAHPGIHVASLVWTPAEEIASATPEIGESK